MLLTRTKPFLCKTPIHQILSCLLIAVFSLGKSVIVLNKVERAQEDHFFFVEALEADCQGDGSARFNRCFFDFDIWRRWWFSFDENLRLVVFVFYQTYPDSLID